MLGKARYLKEPKKGLYQNINYELQYGEFIFGRTQWSKDLKIGEQKIRTCLNKLIEDGMIKKTNNFSKFTVLSVVNYEKFNQQLDIESQQLQRISNQQITSTQPADNQHVTTNKESKESKEGNKKDISTGIKPTNKFLIPSFDEVKEYCTTRNNNVDAEKFIDFYSSKGWMIGKNKMKDWKAAVRTWERGSKNNGTDIKQNKGESKSTGYDFSSLRV